MQLAFLPVDAVVPSFDEVLDLIFSDLDNDFLTYFMTSWIQGVTTARTSKPACSLRLPGTSSTKKNILDSGKVTQQAKP